MKQLSLNDQFSKRIILVNLIINVGIVALIIGSYNFIPPQIPLLYSLPWGDQQLVSTNTLFLIPGLLFLFLVLNFLLATIFNNSSGINQDRLLITTRILSIATLFTALLGGISVIRIIMLL